MSYDTFIRDYLASPQPPLLAASLPHLVGSYTRHHVRVHSQQGLGSGFGPGWSGGVVLVVGEVGCWVMVCGHGPGGGEVRFTLHLSHPAT